MDMRVRAIQEAGTRHGRPTVGERTKGPNEQFGRLVFTKALMKEHLPKDVYRNVLDAMEGIKTLTADDAETIAAAMQDWAVAHGATHFTHWFQPLTGSTAEKHDSFLQPAADGHVIEKFTGSQLVQGEPDASSFPSGGLRSTYEARGYTGWDPSSPVFLWRGGDGLTLCVPSVFFSYEGHVLDNKIPLLRSDQLINRAAQRLLSLTGLKASRVYSTLGLEQEYFVIDRSLRNLRPDLVVQGKTCFGAPPPKGQEMQDHYFGSVKDRVLYFMRDFEEAAAAIGIPLKTRHNEVAPAQHEVAQLFERSALAVDHNILLMELMRRIAVRHDLACLLDEKPFAGLNGSGKHSNWSLATDTGINLLDPTDTPENNTTFLILLTAVLSAVHRHARLLRASISSAGNDCRLGGHEAPPAIISVYLGSRLESLLEEIEKTGAVGASARRDLYNLGIDVLPNLTKDNTDRNRTSPFAFTGNKMEFRAVGASASPAFPATVMNVIVAEALNEIVDEIEAGGGLQAAAMSVLQKRLSASRFIRFSGDNYSDDWVAEAEKRGLPHIVRSVDAFSELTSRTTVQAFAGVLSEEELRSRMEVDTENYCNQIHIQANLMLDMFRTEIVPAAINYEKLLAKTLAKVGAGCKRQEALLGKVTALIEEGLELVETLEEARQHADAEVLSRTVVDIMQRLRVVGDRLETLVDDQLWPLPKYRELLFIV